MLVFADDYVALQADGQVHWFSIINSVLIVLFLSGMVAMIMMRILHRDFRRYAFEKSILFYWNGDV